LTGHPGVDPLVAAAAQGGGRAGVIGDAAVAAAEHQDLDELVEDPILTMDLAATAVRTGVSAGRWRP
jgi:hypothetical protein